MNKELKVIDFYCKKCKKSMKVSYMVTGNRNYPVLPRVMMKCHHCGRVMTLKHFKEGELLDIRASKEVNVICGDCKVPFEKE